MSTPDAVTLPEVAELLVAEQTRADLLEQHLADALAIVQRCTADLEAVADREARRVAGLKARKIPDDVRAAERAAVDKRLRLLTATVVGDGKPTGRSARDLARLVCKALPDLSERRARDYVTEWLAERAERQKVRRDAVARRIERTAAAYRAKAGKCEDVTARYIAEQAAREALDTSTCGKTP